jgi:hypothetical protein
MRFFHAKLEVSIDVLSADRLGRMKIVILLSVLSSSRVDFANSVPVKTPEGFTYSRRLTNKCYSLNCSSCWRPLCLNSRSEHLLISSDVDGGVKV